jgi:polar amino acid transport system substrate-binding protein
MAMASGEAEEGTVYSAGIEAAFPPWAYAEQGEYKGIVVDAVKAIEELESFSVDYRDLPWPSLIPALEQGKIDMVVTGLSVTCERAEILDYTVPFFALKDVVLVQEGSGVTMAQATGDGARIGVQAGSTQHDWVEANIVAENDGVELSTYEDFVLAVNDLDAGRLDAVVVDRLSALQYIEKGNPVEIVGELDNARSVAMAVGKGDPNGLLEPLNRGFVEIYENGTWREILESYLPEGLDIDPIPTAMRDCIDTYQEPVPGLD